MKFAPTGVAIATLTSLVTLSLPAAAADLTVGAFGGLWEKSLRECVIKPFEATSGKTVEVVLGSPVQWMNQILASPAQPPLDVIYVSSDIAFDTIAKGIVQKMDTTTVPNMAKMNPYFANVGEGYGVVHNTGAMGLIWNKETVPNPPTTWAEFFEGTREGRWTASIPSINYPGATSNLWNFAMLNGGGVDDVTPGIEVVKSMQDGGSLEFWADPNQVLNGLQSGELDIAMYWDGRAWAFIDEGRTEEFGYINPAPGAVAAMTWIQPVVNASPLALDFVNTALDPAVQSCFGSAIRYGVGTAEPSYDPAVAHQITRFEDLAFPPFKELTPLLGAWIEAWNKQIGR